MGIENHTPCGCPRQALYVNSLAYQVCRLPILNSLPHVLVSPYLPCGFPSGSDGKEFTSNEGDPGSIPGLGRPLEKRMATYANILAWEIP